jgi:hypothetical protein
MAVPLITGDAGSGSDATCTVKKTTDSRFDRSLVVQPGQRSAIRLLW